MIPWWFMSLDITIASTVFPTKTFAPKGGQNVANLAFNLDASLVSLLDTLLNGAPPSDSKRTISAHEPYCIIEPRTDAVWIAGQRE